MELYNITENLKQLNQMIEDGVEPEQLQDAFNDLEEAFEDKAKNVLYVLKNMASNIDQLKEAEKQLKEKRGVIERQLSGLKDYLLMNMQEFGLSKVDNGVFKASLVKPKPMLNLNDESLVPDEYKQEKITVSVDKKQLLADLKDGKEVEGASIGESKAGLTIK